MGRVASRDSQGSDGVDRVAVFASVKASLLIDMNPFLKSDEVPGIIF
jgi:hypothetical protein